MKKFLDILFPKAKKYNEYGREIRQKEIDIVDLMFSAFWFFMLWMFSIIDSLIEEEGTKNIIVCIVVQTIFFIALVYRFFNNRDNLTGCEISVTYSLKIAKAILYCLISMLLSMLVLMVLNIFNVIEYSLMTR